MTTVHLHADIATLRPCDQCGASYAPKRRGSGFNLIRLCVPCHSGQQPPPAPPPPPAATPAPGPEPKAPPKPAPTQKKRPAMSKAECAALDARIMAFIRAKGSALTSELRKEFGADIRKRLSELSNPDRKNQLRATRTKKLDFMYTPVRK